MKFVLSTAKKIEDANVILFGVPDESGSHATRKGTRKGPDRIRKISKERALFKRKGKQSVSLPNLCPSHIHIFDQGNIKKAQVEDYIKKLDGKFPIILGGDHSITFEVLKGLSKEKNISVVYFDAHPDFVCSSRLYYGSVVCDVLELKQISLRNSVEIGSRAIEEEEMLNLKKRKMSVITPGDITEKGVKKIFQEIKKKVNKGKIYLSIDIDVVDPAFAPGVDTPVPGGLSSKEILYLAKKIAELGLIGLDIMETSPPNDIQDMTSHLASQLIMNTIACQKI